MTTPVLWLPVGCQHFLLGVLIPMEDQEWNTSRNLLQHTVENLSLELKSDQILGGWEDGAIDFGHPKIILLNMKFKSKGSLTRLDVYLGQ